MATPRGAVHRDLEQRIRDLEQRCADLANQVLRQRKLAVTEGDFVVSGGGSVIVEDGGFVKVRDAGGIRVEHPNGEECVFAGDIFTEGGTPTYMGTGLLVQDDAGGDIAQIRTGTSGSEVRFGTMSSKVGILAAYSAGAVVLSGDGGFQVVSGGTTYLDHATTSSAANARLDPSTQQLLRSTSSIRYKQDVQSAEVDPAAMLSAEPRTWRDRAEVAEDPDTEHRHVGFIAEELDAAGLGMFVEYDEQGRPDAIQYDRLTVGLLAVAKDQAGKIAALSARLDALEGSA